MHKFLVFVDSSLRSEFLCEYECERLPFKNEEIKVEGNKYQVIDTEHIGYDVDTGKKEFRVSVAIQKKD